MHNVMIRIGDARKSKRAVFEDPVKAEEYFNELCRRRTEYPATVIIAYRILVKKKYRIDKNFKGERLIILQKIRSLPADKIAEIKDIVDFVRYKNEDLKRSRAAAKLSEGSFKRVWDNPEDEAYDSL